MFAKVFSQIFDSSIANNYTTRHVFIDLLVLADATGIVDMTHEAISRRTNVPIEIIRKSIAELESPDPESRSGEDDGRRLVSLDSHRSWGWQIVNYEHYRYLQSNEARKEYFREKKREQRSQEKAQKSNSQAVKPVQDKIVDKCGLSTNVQVSTKGEEEEEGEEDINSKPVTIGESVREPSFSLLTETPKSPPKPKPKSRNLPTTEPAKRIARLFSRRLTTAWADKEVKAFKALGAIDPEDLDSIERYYEIERAKGEGGIHRKDLCTFLNNFPGELDRANLGMRRKRRQCSEPKDDNTTGPWMTEGITEEEWRQKHEHQGNGDTIQR